MIYTHAAAALVAAVLAFGTAWKVQDWRHGAAENERREAAAEKRRNDERGIDAAATGHEADKRQIRTEFITITERVEHVVQEPFYAAGAPACLDADGMRELAGAIRSSEAPGIAPGAVPGYRPAR